MERISGKIKRAVRRFRNFDGKRGAAFVAALALVASSVLSPITTAMAATATYSQITVTDVTNTMDWPDISGYFNDLHSFEVSGDGLASPTAYCGNKTSATPSEGMTFTNGYAYGSAQVDYIVYHGYSSTNTTGYGLTPGRFYLATQYALWLALPDVGGSHSQVYNELSGFTSAVPDVVNQLLSEANAYAAAGGGGPEAGCAIYWPSPDGVTQGLLTRTNPVGYVQVKKQSANSSITDGNDMYSLEGAVFTVYDSDGSSVGTLTTDASGNTDTLSLTPGTYTIKETTAPEGYYTAADQTVTVTSGQTATVTFSDVPANDPAMMLVGKYDGDKTYTGEGNLPQGSASLAGAEFTVEYYDTLDYDSYDALKDAGVRPTRSWVVRTDSDGYADLSEAYLVSGDSLYYADNGTPTLPRGTVVVYESKAPEGYNLNEDSLSFQKIQEEPIVGTITYNTPQVAEDVIRGGVSVQKVDSQTGQTPQGDASLSGITFSIINDNDNAVIVNGQSFAPGEVVTTITTDDSGYAATASDALPYGDYIIRETSTNSSYLNTANDINVTVSSDGTVYSTTASDDVVRGGVEVYKHDLESDLGTPLGGASLDGTQFEVRLVSGNPVVVNGVTYQAGDVVTTLTIEDGYASTAADALPYGTYSLQEVSVGDGYLLTDGTTYTFTIRQNGTIVNPVTDGAVRNQVKRGDFEFNKKADDSGNRLAGVPFKVTSTTTGESHVVVTDENGYFSSASAWNAHTQNTNGNDWVLDAEGTIDSSQLDSTAGVWFGLTTEGTMVATNDSLGALPYDTYTIEELRCTANDGYQLISATLTITRDGVTVDYGTLDDQPQGSVTIATHAYDPTDRDSSVSVGNVTIADKVTYSGLALGSEYKLVTTIVDATTGETITVNGEPVTATHTFTAEATAGYEVVEMEVPTYELGGKTITVFEELYLVSGGSETLIAEHKDANDVDQQLDVIAPEIGTTAADGVDGDKNVVTDGETTVVDTVSYTNLIPGKEYVLSGTLHVKKTDAEGNVTEEALTDAEGNPVTSDVTFIPEAASGSVDVTFTFDSLSLDAGTEIVAFESLGLDGYELAVHADINDYSQTVTIVTPEIGTTATDGVDGDKNVVTDPETTIVDTVSYTNLIPGKEYVLSGTLMVKGTDDEGNVTEEPLVVNGEQVTAETTFTPETADGTVDVTFTFDSSALAEGTELVAFESLARNDVELAVHADITDEAQTVTIIPPRIGTTAADGFDGDKTVIADSETTIVDTVSYANLIPGKEYVLSGTLMVKGTDDEGNVTEEPLVVNGEQVTAETTFTPETADGTVDVTFTFDSSALAEGTELVAFESLARNDVELAVHADITDEAQTVTIDVTGIGTTATDGLDGDKTVIADHQTSITDTVAYEGALSGTEYTMAGILMDADTGLPILTGDGSEKFADEDVAAFMEQVADALGVTTDDDGNVILPADVDVAALNQLLADNAELASYLVYTTSVFTPETAEGTISMDFAFNANDVIDRLSGETKNVVVFEVMLKGSLDADEGSDVTLVANHTDLDDEGQTVVLAPSRIFTVATDKSDSDHTLMPGQDAVITDTVNYEGLIPGEEYVLKATLYDKETGEPLSVNDKSVTAELRFTPNSQNGSVDIDLGPFDASELNGHTLVVFEELYKQSTVDGDTTDVLVAEHKDINDEGQSVLVTDSPTGDTIEKDDTTGGFFGKTGGNLFALAAVIVVLLVAAGGLTLYGIRKRSAAESASEVEKTVVKPDDGSDA